ncbi:Histone deacetylase 3, partial [Dictyocoela roeselum]
TLAGVEFKNDYDCEYLNKYEFFPSGFCYLNDIVFCINELLNVYERVLYIDIDIHHGDGVEEAFYSSKRVMTLSFHKYGDNYFPGTGELFANGCGDGLGYAINVPLNTGIDDFGYKYIYERITSACINKFAPNAIVFQCGADSICGDSLGCFNLSVAGHAKCVEFINRFDIPILFLGGGGYNISLVPRAWCLETAIICGETVDMNIPDNPYYGYFAPDPVLNPELNFKFENQNSKEYLDGVIDYVLDVLKRIK